MDAIFVDIDNTLVYSVYWDMSPAWTEGFCRGIKCNDFDPSDSAEVQAAICGKFDKAVSYDCATYVSRLRPGAMEFISELKNIAPKVFALSAGLRAFQVEVMTAHGLMPLLDGLYGRESLGSRDALHVVPALPKTLLVDDQPLLSMLAISKLDVMGVLPGDGIDELNKAFDRHYVHIPPFEGVLPDDELSKILPIIRAKAETLK